MIKTTHILKQSLLQLGLFINFLRLIQKMLLKLKKITEKLKTQFILTIKKNRISTTIWTSNFKFPKIFIFGIIQNLFCNDQLKFDHKTTILDYGAIRAFLYLKTKWVLEL